MKNKWRISLIALGLVTIAGTGLGFGFHAANRSGDSPSVSTEPAQANVTVPLPQTAKPGVTAPLIQAAPDKVAAVHPTPGSEAPNISTEVVVAPDPDYEAALRSARISTRGWTTDFSRHTVPYNEILSGGVPRDGIRPIDSPKFESIEETDTWLGDPEPVVVFEQNGDARAYPLRILTSHEIVNDVVGGVAVVVTFCPLCNTAIVFERTLDGVLYDFGVSGNLRKSDLIMWDRQTQSWWQQITGEGIVGELAGRQLTTLHASIVSWEDFKVANPTGVALSRDTGSGRTYARTPYAGYDRADNPPFLFDGDLDGRLLPKERVAAVTIGEVDAAFPFSVLEEERVVNYTVNEKDLVVFFKPGALSVFINSRTGEPDEVGATGLFEAQVSGQRLTFKTSGDRFVDNETGSVWNILGQAVEGPLLGEKLTPIVHANHFWFAWGAFKPDTLIYQGIG